MTWSAALPGAALRMLRTAAGWRALQAGLLVGGVFLIALLCGERAHAADGVHTPANSAAGRTGPAVLRIVSGAGTVHHARAVVERGVVERGGAERVVAERGVGRRGEPGAGASSEAVASHVAPLPAQPVQPEPSGPAKLSGSPVAAARPGSPVAATLPKLPALPAPPTRPVPPESPESPESPTSPALPGLPALPAVPDIPLPPTLPVVSLPPTLPDAPPLPPLPDLPTLPDLLNPPELPDLPHPLDPLDPLNPLEPPELPDPPAPPDDGVAVPDEPGSPWLPSRPALPTHLLPAPVEVHPEAGESDASLSGVPTAAEGSQAAESLGSGTAAHGVEHCARRTGQAHHDHVGRIGRAGHAPVEHGPGGRPDGALGNRALADNSTPRHGDVHAVTPDDRAPLRLVPGAAARSYAAGPRDRHRDVSAFPG
ncbi:hypothetical protein [Streptomyces olindensis]|uniref:hypothetical protein n=1 Tax=Streptomyces olindensis TaxID=358823 RepID=UPI0033EB3B67